MNKDIVLFENIEIPESFSNTRRTGIAQLDGFLSIKGGIVPSMSYMFTGESGAGKTTISNYIMSGVATKESPAVFMSFEMSKEQAKFQFEGKVDFSSVYIVDELKDTTPEGLQALLTEIAELNPSILVVDSLQMLSATIYGDPTSTKGQSDIAKIIMKHSKETGCPSIIIGQCNKEGEYLGPTFVKHILDAHLHASIDKKTSLRNIVFEKNRFGQVGEKLGYAFKTDGAVEFLESEKTQKSLLKGFEWHEAKEIIQTIFTQTLEAELKEIVKSGNPIPQIKFEGDLDAEFSSPNFHFGFNTWTHSPEAPYFLNNTVYVDIEDSKRKFADSNIEKLLKQPLVEKYPQFKTAKSLFLLDVMSCIACGITCSTDSNKKTLKVLDKMISKFC